VTQEQYRFAPLPPGWEPVLATFTQTATSVFNRLSTLSKYRYSMYMSSPYSTHPPSERKLRYAGLSWSLREIIRGSFSGCGLAVSTMRRRWGWRGSYRAHITIDYVCNSIASLVPPYQACMTALALSIHGIATGVPQLCWHWPPEPCWWAHLRKVASPLIRGPVPPFPTPHSSLQIERPDPQSLPAPRLP